MEEKYKKVFDNSGNVKNCGRDVCKELIVACMERWPGIDFGDVESGMMNVENIQKMFGKK